MHPAFTSIPRWADRVIATIALLAVLFSTFDIHLHAAPTADAGTRSDAVQSVTGHVHPCTGHADTDPAPNPDDPDQPGHSCQCVHVASVLPDVVVTLVASLPTVVPQVWITETSEGITPAPEPDPDRLS